jgi:hypothetical protein
MSKKYYNKFTQERSYRNAKENSLLNFERNQAVSLLLRAVCKVVAKILKIEHWAEIAHLDI